MARILTRQVREWLDRPRPAFSHAGMADLPQREPRDLSREEIAGLLKGTVWDYRTDPMDLYDCVCGRSDRAGPFSRKQAFVRLLTMLPWYTMLDLFGMQLIREELDAEALALIWPPGRREHYERLQKLLRGEALPTTGWDPESRKGSLPAVVSHRRHRTPSGGGDFFQVFVTDQENTRLKIDLVNDVAYRVGPITEINGSYIDSIENILTNKIGALYRFAAKDLADLIVICSSCSFLWPEVFQHTQEKVLGISPEGIASLLQTVPATVKSEVLWKNDRMQEEFLDHVTRMSRDILEGKSNGLARPHSPVLKL